MTPGEPDDPISRVLRRIRRAARNGERLHLEPYQARALLDPRIYAVMCEIESEELRAAWQKDTPGEEPADPAVPPSGPALPSASNLAPSGFGIAAIETTGASVGSMAVSRGAHRRVSAVTAQIRQNEQKKL